MAVTTSPETAKASETTSPPVWGRRIATEMRRLRRAAGLSQAQVAKVLECRVPKISLMENGQRHVQDDDLHKLLELYDVPEDDHDYYLAAARKARKKPWWETYDEEIVPEWFHEYLGLEQGANRLRTYHPSIFHGLLQTAEYTAAILDNSTTPMSRERIRRVVAVRRRRQAALRRADDPLRMVAVLDESALRRMVGGPEVMRRQLEHVVELARTQPNLTVQLMPFIRGTYWEGYSIFSFDWPDDAGVVYVEYHHGGVFLESLADVDAHSTAFERLRARALGPEETVATIERAAAEMTDG